MKTRSLKDAVGFYLHSRRRLGFKLESEGALLENFLQHAQELGHRGALTSELALSWARSPRRQTRCGGRGAWRRCDTSPSSGPPLIRAPKLRQRVCLGRLTGELPYISTRRKRRRPCWRQRDNSARQRAFIR